MNAGAATFRSEDARTSHFSLDAADSDHLSRLLLGCAACLYLPFVFMGPGSDPDSIRELRSGATLLWEHRYVLSRPPGYFPYETLCGVLYFIGGSVATNCATVAMSLVLLDSFLRVCEHFEVPHRHLLAATMAIQPVYWTASTSTIDFIWALGCFFLGFRLLLNHRYFGAAVMLGLSVGIRLSSVLMAGPLLMWQLIERPRDAKVWMTSALALAIGAALYVPEFAASGNSFAFLTYYVGAWTWADHFGRFIYKNVYFWGLRATIFLCATAPMLVRALVGAKRSFRAIIVLSLTIVLALEALFLKIPVQRAYLLPLLPFVLILLGIAMRDRPRMLVAMCIVIFSYNFLSVNLARADVADHATRAVVGPFLEPGYLLNDIATRRKLGNQDF
jgi:hypothetical protein